MLLEQFGKIDVVIIPQSIGHLLDGLAGEAQQSFCFKNDPVPYPTGNIKSGIAFYHFIQVRFRNTKTSSIKRWTL